MGYWKLNQEQQKLLEWCVSRKSVEDLGAGDGSLSVLCMSLGASPVIAIDKEPIQVFSRDGLVVVQSNFKSWSLVNMDRSNSVAVVSFPREYEDKYLTQILSDFPIVAYIGCNDGGTACGGPSFWRQMASREVLAHSEARKNNLTIYGGECGKRELLEQEKISIYPSETW